MTEKEHNLVDKEKRLLQATINTLRDELIEAQKNKFNYLEAALMVVVGFIIGVWSCFAIS